MAKTLSVGRRAQYHTIVDNEDYHAVLAFKWTFLVSHPRSANPNIYVRRHRRILQDGFRVRQTYFLAWFILEVCMGLPRPTPEHTADHKNGDTLDNRRTNLRWATRKEQAANRRSKRNLIATLRDYIADPIPF